MSNFIHVWEWISNLIYSTLVSKRETGASIDRSLLIYTCTHNNSSTQKPEPTPLIVGIRWPVLYWILCTNFAIMGQKSRYSTGICLFDHDQHLVQIIYRFVANTYSSKNSHTNSLRNRPKPFKYRYQDFQLSSFGLITWLYELHHMFDYT